MFLKDCAGGNSLRLRGKFHEACKRGEFRRKMSCTVTAGMDHGACKWCTVLGRVICAIKQFDTHKLHAVGKFINIGLPVCQSFYNKSKD